MHSECCQELEPRRNSHIVCIREEHQDDARQCDRRGTPRDAERPRKNVSCSGQPGGSENAAAHGEISRHRGHESDFMQAKHDGETEPGHGQAAAQDWRLHRPARPSRLRKINPQRIERIERIEPKRARARHHRRKKPLCQGHDESLQQSDGPSKASPTSSAAASRANPESQETRCSAPHFRTVFFQRPTPAPPPRCKLVSNLVYSPGQAILTGKSSRLPIHHQAWASQDTSSNKDLVFLALTEFNLH